MSPCEAWADMARIRTRRKIRSFSQRKSSTRGRLLRAAQNNPLDPIVITVGSIHGGTKHNIIPDEVKMQITVRTYKSEVREQVLAAIERIAKGIAAAAGMPPERAPIVSVSKDQFCPATYNNPELTKRLVAVWKKSLGNENVEMVDAMMGGEDFSEYSLPDYSIPAVNFHFGAVDAAKIAEFKQAGKELPTLHSSKFAPVPEPTIRTGHYRNDDCRARLDEEVTRRAVGRTSHLQFCGSTN